MTQKMLELLQFKPLTLSDTFVPCPHGSEGLGGAGRGWEEATLEAGFGGKHHYLEVFCSWEDWRS